MRVIFLDIDGVLNADWDFGGKCKPTPYVIQNGIKYDGICKTHLTVLKEIVDRTDAKIVLVSSWKWDYEQYKGRRFNTAGKYLNKKIRKAGLDIYDTTLRYDYDEDGQSRGREIKEYLREHPEVDGYVILDDEMWRDYDEELKAHLCRTNPKCGLVDAEYPVYILTGVKSEELIRQEAQWASFQRFCLNLTSIAMPELIPAETVIVQPLKK